jgi:alpha-tubulin suppressor-like RCC1 family protein
MDECFPGLISNK